MGWENRQRIDVVKLYLMIFMAICVAIFFIYWAGVRYGAANCAGNVAVDNAKTQLDIFMLAGDVNAETVGRGVDDIRRVLREKYTIAE